MDVDPPLPSNRAPIAPQAATAYPPITAPQPNVLYFGHLGNPNPSPTPPGLQFPPNDAEIRLSELMVVHELRLVPKGLKPLSSWTELGRTSPATFPIDVFYLASGGTQFLDPQNDSINTVVSSSDPQSLEPIANLPPSPSSHLKWELLTKKAVRFDESRKVQSMYTSKFTGLGKPIATQALRFRGNFDCLSVCVIGRKASDIRRERDQFKIMPEKREEKGAVVEKPLSTSPVIGTTSQLKTGADVAEKPYSSLHSEIGKLTTPQTVYPITSTLSRQNDAREMPPQQIINLAATPSFTSQSGGISREQTSFTIVTSPHLKSKELPNARDFTGDNPASTQENKMGATPALPSNQRPFVPNTEREMWKPRERERGEQENEMSDHEVHETGTEQEVYDKRKHDADLTDGRGRTSPYHSGRLSREDALDGTYVSWNDIMHAGPPPLYATSILHTMSGSSTTAYPAFLARASLLRSHLDKNPFNRDTDDVPPWGSSFKWGAKLADILDGDNRGKWVIEGLAGFLKQDNGNSFGSASASLADISESLYFALNPDSPYQSMKLLKAGLELFALMSRCGGSVAKAIL
ncbi:hypothetical protein M427DRAFT_287048 [Gonapodya prolifera JEL478]|uniref:Uncharacterized protein n=1 Tax=Gonapodya prolifera (strain JEL478) TaxID=1344416 RepID=A0A138ZX81_GONPJ|nr:hypothetical protein M427DRAFT_287048 [Gonapodya prolifera JEL478]|eukprot:KXS08885.1 hypothetical protein M427DRAFT_287048 [Gonapodya prolifera JEL478]